MSGAAPRVRNAARAARVFRRCCGPARARSSRRRPACWSPPSSASSSARARSPRSIRSTSRAPRTRPRGDRSGRGPARRRRTLMPRPMAGATALRRARRLRRRLRRAPGPRRALPSPAPVATRDAAAPYWRDVTPTTELRPWPPGEVPHRGLSVERYMHYPVERGAGGASAAAPEPAATAPRRRPRSRRDD